MIEATNTSDLGLIRDATNPMDMQVRQGADILSEMFRHSSQTETAETAEAAEIGGQTATTSTAEGTSSAPPLVQSITPHPRSMPSRFIIIKHTAGDDNTGHTRGKSPKDRRGHKVLG